MNYVVIASEADIRELKIKMITKMKSIIVMEHCVFQQKILDIWCVSWSGTTCLIAKRKKNLWRSAIYSKVLSCKPTFLLKLTLYSSTKTDTPPLFFQIRKIFKIRKIFLRKLWQPWNFLNFSAASALVSYKEVSYKKKSVLTLTNEIEERIFLSHWFWPWYFYAPSFWLIFILSFVNP